MPVHASLGELFPQGIRRGATVSVTSTSLMLLLLAASTQAGSWVAIMGQPHIGVVAARELGVRLERCAFVPYYSAHSAAKVIAALIDAVDFVVLHGVEGVQGGDARRLIARARERKCTLVLNRTTFPGVTPLTLTVTSLSWRMAANGAGRLQGRWMEVTASGRGPMARPLRSSVWLGDAENTAIPARSVPVTPMTSTRRKVVS